MGGFPVEKNRSLILGALFSIAANNAGTESGAGAGAGAAAVEAALVAAVVELFAGGAVFDSGICSIGHGKNQTTQWTGGVRNDYQP